MYSPLIDILFGDFIISKKIHLWNFYFYRTHVKLINYKEYKLYVTNDFNDTSYVEVGKNILQIAPTEEIEHVWVTYSMIEKAYEASPTFAQIRPYMDEKYRILDSWGYSIIDGEIEKDYAIWAIRWAVNDSGLYKDAISTNEFYSKVATELQCAFAEGRLKKRNAIILSNLARPINLEKDFIGITECVKESIRQLINYEKISCALGTTTGNDSNIDIMSNIISTLPSVDLEDYRIRNVSGWIFLQNDEERIQIKLNYNENNIEEVSFSESEDVYLYYKNKGENYKNAQKCRFSFVIPEKEIDTTKIEVYIDEQLIYSKVLSEFSEFSIQGTKSYIDRNIMTTSSKIYYSLFNKDDVELGNKIIKIYQDIAIYINIFVILIYLIQILYIICSLIKRIKVNVVFWLVETGLLLTILANIVVVSINYFDAYNRAVATILYLAGVYPIWQIFVCLTICEFTKYYRNWRKNKSVLQIENNE